MSGYGANESKFVPILPKEYQTLTYLNFDFNAKTDEKKIDEVIRYEFYQSTQAEKNGIIMVPATPGRSEEDIIKKYDEIVKEMNAYLYRRSRKSGIITMSASDGEKDKKEKPRAVSPQEYQEYKRRRKGEAFLRRKFARYPRML